VQQGIAVRVTGKKFHTFTFDLLENGNRIGGGG